MQRRLAPLFLALLALPAALTAGTVTPLREGWRLQSACKLQAAGASIAAEGFATEGWLQANVPSTVLAAQVAAGVLPDPYFGLNLRQIPGTDYPIGRIFANLPMAQESPYRCGWWYRKEFTAPAVSQKDAHYWLHFAGINYRAEIWLNGHKIADSTQIAGAYRTYDLDVTGILKPGKTNVLAVETFASTEKDLGINWVDWNPSPPDKDMGLTGAVDLVTTGSVTLRSPLAVTHFLNQTLDTSELTVYADLHNSADHAVKGLISGAAAGIRFEQPVELLPHEDREIVFTPEQFPQLRIRDPKPWWPRQMGDPHLERLTLSFSVQGQITDEQGVDFGFREITSELTASGSRLFRVNGKPILIRGAGWSQDMLLRSDDKRLRDQFRLVRDLNLNTIRLEGKLETDEFFHLADQQGILVMLGWCCCDHWEHWKDWTPEDLSIATASLRAQMLRLRPHASLLVWLNGSDGPPPANVESAYLKVESETHWPNPVLSSASAASTTVTGPSGVKMTGPYDYVAPSYWYVDRQHGGAYGFNTETSPGPAISSLASRQKFLPVPEAWPPSAAWSYHYGSGKFSTPQVFDEAMEAIYTKPHSAPEYERLAQAMEYDSERAMFEAYSKNKYASTGVVQWMLNNAWPSMIWHLYDYYLRPGGGYFGAKRAMEALHPIYGYDDHSIWVVSSQYEDAKGLKLTTKIYDLDMTSKFTQSNPVDAPADSTTKIFTFSDVTDLSPTYFVVLRLEDSSGKLVGSNFYWLSTKPETLDWAKTTWWMTPTASYADFTALSQLPKVKLKVTERSERKGEEEITHVVLQNPSKNLAFFVRLKVDKGAKGEEILPVVWEDNYISLLPGEKREVTATYRASELGAAKPSVEVSGWNVEGD